MFCGLKKEKFSVLNKYVTLLNEFLSVFTFNFQNPNVGETIVSIFRRCTQYSRQCSGKLKK